MFRLNFYDSSMKMHRGPVSLKSNLESVDEEDCEQAEELVEQNRLNLQASIEDSLDVRIQN